MAQIEIRLLPLSYPETQEIVLNEGSHLIGRETQMFQGLNDVQRKKLSREHGRLEINGSTVYLFDLSSTNGTKVNNVPIHTDEPNSLADGDIINFANVFEYRLKIASRGAEDTVVTQMTEAPNGKRPLTSNQTLFLASADSYLDMLYDEGSSDVQESGSGPGKTPKNKLLLIVLIALSVIAIVGGLAFYWLNY